MRLLSGWPPGCLMCFAFAYLWFFCAMINRKPGWDWSVVAVPILIYSLVVMFNGLWFIASVFDRNHRRSELTLGYVRSLGALSLIFAPLAVMAWLIMGRPH